MNSNNAITKETIEMVKTLNPDLFDEIKGACLRCTIWFEHTELKMEERLYNKYGVEKEAYLNFYNSHYEMLVQTRAYVSIKYNGMNVGCGDALGNFQGVLSHVLKSDRLLDELVTKTIISNNPASESLEIPSTAFDLKLY